MMWEVLTSAARAATALLGVDQSPNVFLGERFLYPYSNARLQHVEYPLCSLKSDTQVLIALIARDHGLTHS